ncbi:MAG: TetR family transcriptional regulator C-terminal domain-containing protein [Firmicutes bacterium]|nr:TetR family transcriptional regulator C-terminal domain-containing protein [Bacillota bacterium]
MGSKRKAVIDALIEMMDTMSLDDIRAEDLIKRSGVSKTTFYRLFHDKYDVMNSAYLDASTAVVHKDPDMKNMRLWTIEDCNHIAKNPRFYQKILSYHGQNSFRDTIKAYYYQNIQRHVEMKANGHSLTDQEQYAICVYSEIAAFAMTWWIADGCQRSPEQLENYQEDCIPQCLRRYFDLEESSNP